MRKIKHPKTSLKQRMGTAKFEATYSTKKFKSWLHGQIEQHTCGWVGNVFGTDLADSSMSETRASWMLWHIGS
jgi:hypothetical protein